MTPDEVAQAATHYIKTLVEHIGEHRSSPADDYPNASKIPKFTVSVTAAETAVSSDGLDHSTTATTVAQTQRDTAQFTVDGLCTTEAKRVREFQCQQLQYQHKAQDNLTQHQSDIPQPAQVSPQLETHSSSKQSPTLNNTQLEQAFPTEAALKAKEKRVKIKEEQGISCHQQQKTTKSTKTIQEHYDDCGSDISPLLKYEKTTNYYTKLEEFCESQHKFHTSFDLITLYGPHLLVHERLPPDTIRHRDAKEHFAALQQANDTYHSLDLQLEINHCVDGNYRIVSRHGTSYYIQDHMTIQPGPIPLATTNYMQQVLQQFPTSCLKC